MNGFWFDPESKSAMLYARVEDISDINQEEGMVTIAIENLDEGIEIFYEGDRLWRPIDRAT